MEKLPPGKKRGDGADEELLGDCYGVNVYDKTLGRIVYKSRDISDFKKRKDENIYMHNHLENGVFNEMLYLWNETTITEIQPLPRAQERSRTESPPPLSLKQRSFPVFRGLYETDGILNTENSLFLPYHYVVITTAVSEYDSNDPTSPQYYLLRYAWHAKELRRMQSQNKTITIFSSGNFSTREILTKRRKLARIPRPLSTQFQISLLDTDTGERRPLLEYTTRMNVEGPSQGHTLFLLPNNQGMGIYRYDIATLYCFMFHLDSSRSKPLLKLTSVTALLDMIPDFPKWVFNNASVEEQRRHKYDSSKFVSSLYNSFHPRLILHNNDIKSEHPQEMVCLMIFYEMSFFQSVSDTYCLSIDTDNGDVRYQGHIANISTIFQSSRNSNYFYAISTKPNNFHGFQCSYDNNYYLTIWNKENSFITPVYSFDLCLRNHDSHFKVDILQGYLMVNCWNRETKSRMYFLRIEE
jgi:hypothetical protein